MSIEIDWIAFGISATVLTVVFWIYYQYFWKENKKEK